MESRVKSSDLGSTWVHGIRRLAGSLYQDTWSLYASLITSVKTETMLSLDKARDPGSGFGMAETA